MSWFVVRTLWGYEARIAKKMESAGCSAWFPKQQVYVRRKGMQLLPLGNYVFVEAESVTPDLWHTAGDEEGFSAWYGGEEPTALRPGELEVFRSELEGDAVDWETTMRLRFGFAVGDTVLIVLGLWAGKTAAVTAFLEKNFVSAKISTLHGFSIRLKLPANHCSPVLLSGDGRALGRSERRSTPERSRQREMVSGDLGSGRRLAKRKRRRRSLRKGGLSS